MQSVEVQATLQRASDARGPLAATVSRLSRSAALIAVASALAAAGPAAAAPAGEAPATKAPAAAGGPGVTDQDILNDAKTPGDVVSYGMGPHQHRFSPLAKINDKNVSKL